MALQLQTMGLFVLQRLVRVSRSRSGLQKFSEFSVIIYRRGIGTSTRRRLEEQEDNSSNAALHRRMLLSRRRRPLSPLERISTLLPEDSLTPEVTQLRDQQHEQREETEHGLDTDELNSENNQSVPDQDQDSDSDGTAALLPGESLLSYGEILIAEFRKKHFVQFQKMFKLQMGALLNSSWGYISHDDVVGQCSGRFYRTSQGTSILIRRVSLEEYVLFMKRAPAISYPKDIASMMVMMDVTHGDTVLDSGSGSGAMSLFLSRAVGSKGRVLSVDVREDHHKRAVLNYERWRTTWRLRRGEDWPDNVQYRVADLSNASSLLAGHGFNSVALDLIHPQLVLETVTPHLHLGGVCAIYLANITQVVDLLEGIRCTKLPLQCERIIEIPVRNWLVAPAIQKDGRYCMRKAPGLGETKNEGGDDGDEEIKDDASQICSFDPEGNAAFGSVPYIARPHPEQNCHTAFLVKLRKFSPS